LGLGQYTFDVDAGPDYRIQTGHFEIQRNANDTKRIEMNRFANLNKEGWWAGDLDVARRSEDMPLIQRAEGLSVMPFRDPPVRNASARRGSPQAAAGRSARSISTARPSAQLEKRTGSEMLSFGLAGETPAPPVRVARTPYAWDLPVWLASDELDAIQIIHHHALADGVVDNEQDGRPRDPTLFPGRNGNARWSEAVYHHVLNCGLRIPPVAGSGSGENNSPVGTNRVYVYCGSEFSPGLWWEGLKAGRVFVTSGPLVRPMVQGQPPGYVFRLSEGERLSFEIGLELATRTPIEYLQIIKNGEVDSEVRLSDWKGKTGRLPPVSFDDSGWFLVRAVTDEERKYELASTGPYYVEKSGRPRISRRSVRFFLDWIAAAERRIHSLPDVDEAGRAALLAEQAAARKFFDDRLIAANAD
jgi:hypothetical protein